MIRVKICGMCEPSNVAEIAEAKPDFLGFIFYRRSQRYVGEEAENTLFAKVPAGIIRTGVFLNENNNTIMSIAIRTGLEMIQLHGNETTASCNELKSAGLTIVKAFNIGEDFDFKDLEKYNSACDFFLFDTKSSLYGGSGKKFDWRKLEEYSMDKPFFLSGGIGPDDADAVKSVVNRGLFAVDINSRFEITPGIKDPGKVRKFIKDIKSVSHEL
jgi:phosphoribosylanthranilate isomerase